MKTKLLLLALALTSVSSFAQHRGNDYATQTTSTETARVLRVTLQTESVPVDRQVCETRSVQQQVQPAQQQGYGGTILGTVIGGVLGSQVGGGNGRLAATAVGAGIGAAIGNNSDRQTAPAPAQYANVPVQQCHLETVYESQKRGYLVAYEYQGRQYSAITQTDPGRQIRVHVSVTPAQD